MIWLQILIKQTFCLREDKPSLSVATHTTHGAAQSASEICLLNDAGDICAFSLCDNAVWIVIVMASCNPNAVFI